jgi:hypothetical protein
VRFEDRCIGRNQGSIASRRPKHKAPSDVERLLPTDPHGCLLSSGDLPVEVAGQRTDIADDVDALDDGESSPSIVAQEDVNRMSRGRGANWQLERPADPLSASHPQDQLLHGEVSDVGRFIEEITLEATRRRRSSARASRCQVSIV